MTMIDNGATPIRLVVFDMAGTTVFDGDAVNHCLAEALQTFNCSFTRDEINAVMGIEKPVAIRMLLESRPNEAEGQTSERVDEIYREFLRNMTSFYETHESVRAVDGAESVFRCLKSNGVKVVLDSGFSRQIIDVVIDRLGWNDSELVDLTVASDEVERGRPYPDLIFRAMDLTGVDDVKAVAKVGDTPSDLLEGTSAGCGLVIGVTTGSHTHEELESVQHTHLIRSIADLGSVMSLGLNK